MHVNATANDIVGEAGRTAKTRMINRVRTGETEGSEVEVEVFNLPRPGGGTWKKRFYAEAAGKTNIGARF